MDGILFVKLGFILLVMISIGFSVKIMTILESENAPIHVIKKVEKLLKASHIILALLIVMFLFFA